MHKSYCCWKITTKKIAWFNNVTEEPSSHLIRSPKDLEEGRNSREHIFHFAELQNFFSETSFPHLENGDNSELTES